MLQAASSATGLRTTVIRTGQLAGARSSGAWTTSEWFAAMIKSSETLGCLPNGGDVRASHPLHDHK
jgi:thioester reductase-like protein